MVLALCSPCIKLKNTIWIATPPQCLLTPWNWRKWVLQSHCVKMMTDQTSLDIPSKPYIAQKLHLKNIYVTFSPCKWQPRYILAKNDNMPLFFFLTKISWVRIRFKAIFHTNDATFNGSHKYSIPFWRKHQHIDRTQL